ncbi:MAG: amidohydrolase [Alphaproteobacteria bacterium]|nr:amidohydrolase [Alphaproteobacteria bacterium]
MLSYSTFNQLGGKEMGGTWLSERELALVDGAEKLNLDLPIPTQIVSNGEYLPPSQSNVQKQVEALTVEMADKNAKHLNMSRRQYLQTSCGMATAFLAMNQIYGGGVFKVNEAEARDPEMMLERTARVEGQFIFDDQTHFLRDDFPHEAILGLGEFAAEHWNPKLKEEGLSLTRYKFENYIAELWYRSDTKMSLLSGAPFDDPSWWLLHNDQIVAARDMVNDFAGSQRMLGHTVITPGQDGWMDEVDRAIEVLKPDSWKSYTIGDPLSPSKYPWRLDDEELMYPFYEKAVKAARNGGPKATICIHKGLLPPDYETSFKGVWQYATVDDVPKAAQDWPEMNFVIYHSALRPFLELPDQAWNEFEESGGYIKWASDLAAIPEKYGVTNVYGEIGSTFANSAVAHPRFCAAFIGTLVKGMGADHVVWGSDTVWYGSPQWQIEAMRRLEVPEDMQKKYGLPALGGENSLTKQAIFGLNSARIYELGLNEANNLPDMPSFSEDKLGQLAQKFREEGGQPSNKRYGLIRNT